MANPDEPGPKRRTPWGPAAGGVAWLAVLLLGCGARAAGAPADEENLGTAGVGAAGGRGGLGRGASGAGSGAAPANDPIVPGEPGVQLPECEPGFAMSARRECSYTFRGACYDDQLLACACACEGLADSRCIIQGFLNPNEPQRVSCIER